MTPARRVDFLGCPIDLLTSRDVLQELKQAIDTRSSAHVIQFANANKVAQVREDAAFGDLLWRSDYVLADGQPLLPMARFLGIHIPERIDGIGFMHKMLKLASEHGYRIFLLGARQQVLEACVRRIQDLYPGIHIAGYRNGYFSKTDLPEVLAQVRAARADILFLGMGSPMKEEFADQHRQTLGATVIQGVGGSFDVIAGLVKRAPVWMQRLGLEWLFRVMQEPRRMFWRYATTNAQCLYAFGLALLGAGSKTARH